MAVAGFIISSIIIWACGTLATVRLSRHDCLVYQRQSCQGLGIAAAVPDP